MDETECEASFHIFSDQVVLEERPTNIETTPVAPYTSEELLVRAAVTSIPLHAEEALSKLVLKTLTVTQRCRQSCIDSLKDLIAPHRMGGRERTGVHEAMLGCRH